MTVLETSTAVGVTSPLHLVGNVVGNAVGDVRPSRGPVSERRARMIAVATRLASVGGYEAVQMRAVARQTPVAMATLYRHFPSKVHLLVSAMEAELTRAQDRIDRVILRGNSSYERVMLVVGALTRTMQRDARLTEAMTRALMFADAGAADEVDAVRALIDEMFARAATFGDPNPGQLAIGRVIGDVWLTNTVAWATQRLTAAEVSDRIALSIALLLGEVHADDIYPR